MPPADDDDSGAGVPSFAGDELALVHHERFVDLDDHPLIVLLERGLPEAADAGVGDGATVTGGADPGSGEPHHHFHVRVAEPDEEPLGGSDDEVHELDPGRYLEAPPPEPPPPAGGHPAAAVAEALVAPPCPESPEPLVDTYGDGPHWLISLIR